jgi:hypothetical protein
MTAGSNTMMRMSAILLLVIAVSFASVAQAARKDTTTDLDAERNTSDDGRSNPSPYLFIWAGDAARTGPDFLAVVDARSAEPTYGQIVATVSVGNHAQMPHHTEYEFPRNGILFANDWAAGNTFLIDLNEPLKPIPVGQFTQVGGYFFPHSFVRLSNGHVLATFQARSAAYEPPGGLVELDATGQLVRAASAAVPGMDDTLIWPYSLAVLPAIDRVVTTSSQMGLPNWLSVSEHGSSKHAHDEYDTYHVQIWSLSDLRLLRTIPLPESANPSHHLLPAEPRVLEDGTVYVNTFDCGLYRLTGVEGANAKADFVYAFPGGLKDDALCGVPVVYGNFWIQTVPALPGLIALDVSDPTKPVEASRLVFNERFSKVHWVAADRASSRLVVTGANQSWVLVVNIDRKTGELTLDEKFRDKGSAYPGIEFSKSQWPHGGAGRAEVHGALFGPAP